MRVEQLYQICRKVFKNYGENTPKPVLDTLSEPAKNVRKK